MKRVSMLVLSTLVLAACGGGGGEPTEPPVTVSGTETGTPSSPGATGDAIEVEAENVAFETDTIEAAAGSAVSVELKNRDAVPHNISFYTDESASEEIYVGDTITGPDAEIVYSFDAPAEAGTYYFRCDVHPNMNGSFVVA